MTKVGADDPQTWYLAFGLWVLSSLSNDDPRLALLLYVIISNDSLFILMGIILK